MPVYTTTWEVEWVNPAGSSKGTRVNASIIYDPEKPATAEFQVPIDQYLVIYDMYKNAGVTKGGKIRLTINGREHKWISPDVLNMDPGNPQRPRPPVTIIGPGKFVRFDVFVNANPDTVDATESAILHVAFADSLEEALEFVGTLE